VWLRYDQNSSSEQMLASSFRMFSPLIPTVVPSPPPPPHPRPPTLQISTSPNCPGARLGSGSTSSWRGSPVRGALSPVLTKQRLGELISSGLPSPGSLVTWGQRGGRVAPRSGTVGRGLSGMRAQSEDQGHLITANLLNLVATRESSGEGGA
jgi:hypothetical protein